MWQYYAADFREFPSISIHEHTAAGCTQSKFSKTRSIVMLHSTFSSELTWRNFFPVQFMRTPAAGCTQCHELHSETSRFQDVRFSRTNSNYLVDAAITIFSYLPVNMRYVYIYTKHCNTLQHTATHCNTLQHTATHCITLQHTRMHWQMRRLLFFRAWLVNMHVFMYICIHIYIYMYMRKYL